MADTISSANRIARHPQGRITAATAIGVNAPEADYAFPGLNAEDVGR
ncbi:hypothetical protein ACVWWG_000409 [Bradyrhizobium sp. LB7.2]